MLIVNFETKDAPYFTMGDSWRVSAKAIHLHDEALIGIPVIACNVEVIPDNINDTIVKKAYQSLEAMCLPKSPDIKYITYFDEKNKWKWGIAYVYRATHIGNSEAVRHRGVVFRCAICGQTSRYGVITNCNFIGKIVSYYLCANCNNYSPLGTASVVTCWCGYRFLSGEAEWYFNDSSVAKCPNCGITIAGSGAVMIDGLTLDKTSL